MHVAGQDDQLDAVLAILSDRGYVRGWSVTTEGEMLAGLYHEADLLIGETLRAGLLNGLEPAALAAVASACACAFLSSSIRFCACSSSPPRLPRSVSSRETSCPSDESLLESTVTRASRVAMSFLCWARSFSRSLCVAASFSFCASRSLTAAL